MATEMKLSNLHNKTLLEIRAFITEQSACFDSGHDLQGVMAEKETRPGNSDWDTPIHHLSLDSRQISQNDLFFAIQGESRHGIDFLGSVLEKLPGLVICDRVLNKQEQLILDKAGAACQVWIVEDIKEFIGHFASWFYDSPSQHLKVVGITGTNGKTSTAFYTGQLLKGFGVQVALIGTLGNGSIDALVQSNNTTPESVTVHRLLHEFYQQGIEWVIMEVSSHGLCLGRIQEVHFQTVALTQVTRDHIDFHGTEEAYKEAKTKLFSEYPTQNQVLNLDDSVGEVLCKKQKNHSALPVWCYSANQQASHLERQADLSCSNAQLSQEGIVFDCSIQGKQAFKAVKLPLMGAFNIENSLCALSILLVNGFDSEQLFSLVNNLTSVSGRMQVLAKSPTIILDFAHTPDALQQVLLAVKAHLSLSMGKLTVVFGCGGNRDQGKRPLMAAIAEKLADKVMLTSDNPRDEKPEQILLDIEKGLTHPEYSDKELDREAAILKVLNCASENDIVVIAGKGHEDYQEISGKKIPYSDAAVVTQWLTLNSRQ